MRELVMDLVGLSTATLVRPRGAEAAAVPRTPAPQRGGTLIDVERAVVLRAPGPKGSRPVGLLDCAQGVYQHAAEVPWLDADQRLVHLPLEAWAALQAGVVTRLEFCTWADNRVLVIDMDTAARLVSVGAGPNGGCAFLPLEAFRLWRPPADATDGVHTRSPLESRVDTVVDRPPRPSLSSTRILLDAGPSERGWHHAQTMLRCPQLYAYRYIIGNMDATRRPPLIKGSLVHIGLAHYYARVQAKQMRADPERFFTPTDAIRLLAGRYGDHWQEWQDLAISAVEAYIRKHGVERYRVLQVEEQLRCHIAGHVFTQRVDLAVQDDATGLIEYWDHKSAGRVTKKTVERYTLSGQFLGLTQFGWALHPGGAFSCTKVNVVGLADPHRFVRRVPEPAPHALACFPEAIIYAEEDIVRLKASNRDPWHWPKRLNEQVCNTIYGDCDGHSLCRFGPAK
jgi:hypothetical protein